MRNILYDKDLKNQNQLEGGQNENRENKYPEETVAVKEQIILVSKKETVMNE